jgi:hypothetical protein
MMRPPRQSPARRAAGTVLIVAMLVLAFIALILGSYLNLNLTTARLASRSYCADAAFNLAEAGAEEALWSFNQTAAGSTTAWAEWEQRGGAAWHDFTGFNLSANATGSVKVYVDNTSIGGGLQPRIVALGSADPADGAPTTKMLEITLRRRSLFAGGLVAKRSVAFQGSNASVDSWNSDPDQNPATPAVPYSTAVRRDGGGVASTSVLADAAQLNQANIWGYVATGGAAPQVGVNGTIRGASTPAGVQIDPSRVSTDFAANLPPVAAPAGGTDIAAITGSTTLGTAGLATSWRCPAIALAGRDTLTIQGNVTLVVTAAPGTRAVSITGQAAIDVPAGASLALYLEGDLLIAGNGLFNGNAAPASCIIWGTGNGASAQRLAIAGHGALKVAIYAPDGAVTINGNGDVMGSVVADTITLTGNAAFHYDEALATYGTAAPYGVARWRELTTAADRQPYEAVFAGW